MSRWPITTSVGPLVIQLFRHYSIEFSYPIASFTQTSLNMTSELPSAGDSQFKFWLRMRITVNVNQKSTTVKMSPLSFISPLSTRIALSSPVRSTICAQCRRSFAANAILSSGHNKWSKIKHDKAAADKKKNAQRSNFAKQMAMYSKSCGALFMLG